MDYDKLDPDHFTRLSAYTQTIHRDVYPAVLPTNPDLSVKGRIVIVTGAGSGIGATGIVPAFAAAGAAGIVLVGRRPDKLSEVSIGLKTQYPTTKVLEVPTDITKPAEVKSLFDTVHSRLGQPADILINNAGVRLALMPLMDSDADAWWGDLEVNVKGTYLVTREFLKALGSERPGVIVNISSAATTVNRPGNCSYSLSKLAISRMAEYVELENKNVVCIALNPGTVKTEMVLGPLAKFAQDTPELVGGVCVWLSSPAAKFLNGRCMSVNWDIEELLARQDQVVKNNELKFTLTGTFGVAT